jgi:hypothetical protein
MFAGVRAKEVVGIIQAGLPVEPNSFVGREGELGELRQLVHSVRVLTLCGPGGIGKTRLALRLLALMATDFALVLARDRCGGRAGPKRERRPH